MPIVEAHTRIRATPAELFDLAQSYELRLAWDPFLKSMEFLDGAPEPAAGVRVRVRSYNGLAMTVRYVTLRRPTTVAMTMTEGPWFFETFSGSWRFAPAEGAATDVTFRYHFACSLGLLNGPAHAVIKRVFQRDVEARLAGLKRGAEELGLLARLPAPA